VGLAGHAASKTIPLLTMASGLLTDERAPDLPRSKNTSRPQLRAGKGILKVARELGVGSGTVQRVRQEMTGPFADAAAQSAL
jgi:hypothetical protein